MSTASQIQQTIIQTQSQLESLVLQIQELELQKDALTASLRAIERSLLSPTQPLRDWLLAQQKATQTKLNGINEELKNLYLLRDKLLNSLTQLEKDLILAGDGSADAYYLYTKNVGKLPTDFPVLLFPVRLETRFHQESSGQHQLWIRVYPDTCQSATDRNYLAEEEVNSLIEYIAANNDLLAVKHGNHRNAFIKNWLATQNKASVLSLLQQYRGTTDPAVKDKVVTQLKLPIRSEAPLPVATTLPQNFVFRLIDFAGKAVYTQVGNQLPDVVPMSIDEKNRDSEWLHQFDKAVQLGLGIKINISPTQYQKGFAKVVVWGLRHHKTPAESQQELENLLENHFYSSKGLALLKPGTPTNNADDASSGYSWTSSYQYQPDAPPVKVNPVVKNTEAESFHLNDGQLLSQSLGINDALLQKLQNAQDRSINEARAMNSALFPATLSYYLQEMMTPLLEKAEVDRIESFFTTYVSGRGALPAIRIANQPYGILPASVFKKLNLQSTDPIRNRIVEKIKRVYPHWEGQVDRVKRVDGNQPVSAEDMLDILSLHPASVSYYQRYMEQAETKLNAVNSTHSKLDLDAAWMENHVLEPYGLTKSLTSAGFDSILDRPDIFYTVFQTQQIRLTGPWVEAAEEAFGMPLKETFSETTGLRKNYIDWLLRSSADEVRQEIGFDGDKHALLYLLLRHAFLLKQADTAVYLKALQQAVSFDKVKIQYLDNQIISHTQQSKLGLLYETDEKITGSKTQPLYDFIKGRVIINQGVNEGIAQLLNYLSQLKTLVNMPTAALQRVLAEHVDLCSYRIDGWINGAIAAQLRKQRKEATSDTWKKGIYLGVYGYLENVKPFQRDSYGYMLAPSLNHAATGAILKNAQISYAENAANPYSINLSSTRVKWAIHILEAMRQGQELPEILGYRFERSLQKQQLDKYTKELRDQYPLVAARAAGSGTAEESVSPRNVVHGLKLITAFETNPNEVFSALPGITPAEKNQIQQGVDDLRNSLDALKDILLAEGVYQAVSSNFDRGAAALDALQKATRIPDLEVIKTPRKGVLLTHRVAWQWPVVQTVSSEKSLHALLTPSVNAWLKTILPDPNKIVCTCAVNGTKSLVTQQMLELSPIDLLYMLNFSHEKSLSLLDDYIYCHLAKTQVVSTLEISYTEKSHAAEYTFFELAAWLQPVKKMLSSGGYLTSSSFSYDTQATPDAYTLVQPTQANLVAALIQLLEGFQMAQYQNLATQPIDQIITKVSQLFTTLTRAGETRQGIGPLLDRLFIEKAKPTADQIIPTEVITAYISQVSQHLDIKLKALYTIRQSLADELKRQAQLSTTAVYSFDHFATAMRTALGTDCILLPDVYLGAAGTEIGQAMADSAQLLDYSLRTSGIDFPLQEWLMGIARVREKMQYTQQVVQYAELITNAELVIKPAQLPYESKDRWLALAFRDDKDAFTPRDKLLYTCIGDVDIDFTVGTPVCGMVIDEWTELIPNAEETAGLSFHYNQPNAEAPQTILLATPPVLTEKGTWKLEEVYETITSTLDLARIRAVEPTHLDSTPLAQLVPAIVLSASLYDVTPSTNLLRNIKD